MIIIMYDGTQAEYNRIVAEQAKKGFPLIEISNVKEGNFLGFDDRPDQNTHVVALSEIDAQVKALDSQVKSLDAQVKELNTITTETKSEVEQIPKSEINIA